jgi:hypothetical protein
MSVAPLSPTIGTNNTVVTETEKDFCQKTLTKPIHLHVEGGLYRSDITESARNRYINSFPSKILAKSTVFNNEVLLGFKYDCWVCSVVRVLSV